MTQAAAGQGHVLGATVWGVNGKLVKRLEEFPEDLRIRRLPWVKGGEA